MVRRHVVEDRVLAEVEADHLRHVRIDRLVVCDPGADGVRERHVPGSVCVQQPRHAEQAVLPEGERVEEVVVDAPVDDVDALHATGRAVEDAVAMHDEIPRLDDLDAHLAPEERVLEVGGVVRAGREEDDARLAPRRSRRHGAERLEQLAWILVDRAHAVAVEERGEDALERLAALEHVAHPRRGAEVVLQHEVPAIAVAHEVDAADVGVDIAGDVEADHLPPEVARAEDEVGRHDPGLEDLLAVVDVGEEEVQRAQPLHEAALDHLPLVRGNDPWHEIEREDPVGACVVAVDGEPDALGEEEGVRDPDPLVELARAHCREALREQPVVHPRMLRGLEHLVEERSHVVAGGQAAVGPGCDIGSNHGAVCVHPAPFTSVPVAAVATD